MCINSHKVRAKHQESIYISKSVYTNFAGNFVLLKLILVLFQVLYTIDRSGLFILGTRALAPLCNARVRLHACII